MQYEVEIKSLLGGKERAEQLKRRMCELDPAASCISNNRQLNHYFTGGDLKRLAASLAPLFSEDKQTLLRAIAEKAKEYSVRSRDKDGAVFFVVKASVDDTTSSNGISRIEFEEEVPLPLGDLDQKILDAGFEYQAKWSREREEYRYKGVNVCIDKNAGYGYLAEFERLIDSDADIEAARRELRTLMQEVGAEELPQDRLGRMFDHYNKNWREYYGTEKTFVIE